MVVLVLVVIGILVALGFVAHVLFIPAAVLLVVWALGWVAHRPGAHWFWR